MLFSVLLLGFLFKMIVLQLEFVCSSSNNDTTNIQDIYILGLVPWPDDRDHADWDAGPDLLAGARVALEEINNSSDRILPNYRLVLIERGHEACGLVGGNMGIVNLVTNAIDSPHRVAAVLGMFCSTSTKIISPLAGTSGVDLIQLSASNSPDFLTYRNQFPHLWRFLESATVHADTMISIMDRFHWTKVAVIADFENPFHSGIGASFIQTITKNRPDIELLYRGNLLQLSNIEQSVLGILESKARIIFLSTTAPQAAKIYCEAVKYNMYWPNYVWLLADYFAIDVLREIEQQGHCTVDELRKVMEGSLLTYVTLEPSDPSSTRLVSGFTYQDFKEKYEEEVIKIRLDYPGINIPGEYLYAGIMYDQVWAFAKMIQSALPELESMNYSISNYGYGQPHITEILEKYLLSLDFVGATGNISFNENKEISNSIVILQVFNFTDVSVGQYDGGNLVIDIPDAPSDDVAEVTNLLPQSLAIIIITLSIVMVLVVTVNLIVTIVLRNHPEIRALSPNLSLLIFLGCYLECLASILLTIQVWIDVMSPRLFTIWCNMETWIGLLGIYLILTTNLLKIARIFRIFTHFGKTSRFWSDRSLCLWVALICGIPCLLLIIWVLTDPLIYTTKSNFHTDVVPVYIELSVYCYCKYYVFWFTFLYCYVAILIFGLIFFAIQTRKISRRDFKDTKKVNGFVFVMTFVLSILFTTQQVLLQLEQYVYSNMTLCLLFLSSCLICQVFLFMPKVFPASFTRARTGTITSRKGSTRKGSTRTRPPPDERPPSPHTFTKSIKHNISRSSIFSQFH